MMGVVDLLLAFPSLILALAVAGALGPGLFNVLLAAGAVWWVGHARIIRGITLGARQMEYVTAATGRRGPATCASSSGTSRPTSSARSS